MPDIEIVVEASLGDSLAKLGLAKAAVDDLGDSSGSTSHKISSFNRSMDDATIAGAKAGEAILKADHLIRDAENTINDVTTAIDGGGSGRGGFGGGFVTALNAMAGAAGTNVPLLFGLSAPIAALPLVAGAAAIAIVALADAVGTLVAITADLVAPLTLVGGLLGILGLGFALAAKRASEGGGTLSQFSDKLATLHSMFSKTTDILAHAFLPYLLKLADGAERALLFIDKLAREPLTTAFKDMSTQGVQMLNGFIQSIAGTLAHPIRIAFKIAFGEGKGGNEIASAVASWWHQFTDYLFGYSESHQIHIGRFLGRMTHTQVDGIFQPLLDWFNRHHFTRQGTQIGHEILAAFLSSGVAQRMSDFLVQVLDDAAKTVARGFVNNLGTIEVWWLGLVNTMGIDLVKAIESAASRAWAYLVSVFSHPLDLLLNIQAQVPSWLEGLLPGGSIPTHGRGGGGGAASPTGHVAARIAGGGISFHFHAASHMSPAAERAAFQRFAGEVGRTLVRQQGLLAGGH